MTLERSSTTPAGRRPPLGITRALVVLAGLCAASPVDAHEPCGVAMAGDPAPAWAEAARDLAASSEQQSEADCGHVLVTITGGRAHLTFTTRDGRRATRDLEDPIELVPTVQALRTTFPLTAPAPTLDSRPRERSARAPAPVKTDPDDRGAAAARTQADEGVGIYGAQVGARAGAGMLVSPLLEVFAAVTLGRWELGVLGRAEGRYKHLLKNESAEISAFSGGITVGRREPVGDTVALLGGGSFQLAGIHDERDPDKPGTAAEARLGVYAGLALPRRSAARVRANLTAEMVPHRLGGSGDDVAAGPNIPWLAIGLSLGVEMGGP